MSKLTSNRAAGKGLGLTPQQSLDLALDYIALNPGRFIFPIARGKKFPPLIKNMLADASDNENQIKLWCAKWPGCNWGLAHKKSRILVVDVDTKPGKAGQRTFDELDIEHGFPPTEMTRTPSGGFHLVYEGDHIFALGKYGFGEDIDSPNYSLIAGCSFTDGTSYKSEGNAPTAKAPAWFYDVLGKAKVKKENAAESIIELDKPENIEWTADFLQKDAEPAIEGKGGDFQTLKIAMGVRDKGISEEMCYSLMLEIYNPRCEPEWEPEALRVKVKNAYNYASQSAGGDKTAEAEFEGEDLDLGQIPIRGTPETIKKEVAARKAKIRRRKDDPAKPWNTECAVIVSPASFVEIATKKMLSTKSFNNKYGAVGGHEAHKKGIQSKTIARYGAVCYRPGGADVVEINGIRCFNMYVAPKIELLDDGQAPTVFLEHLEYLIEDAPSREAFVDWLAWEVQRPGQKLMFSTLLLGNKRTGKSWFANLRKILLGVSNCSEPSRKQVASAFNGWLAYKHGITIHELQEKGAHGLYDELKEVITQETVRINLKGIEAFDVENHGNVLSITNHDNAIPIDDQEGRYLVIRCADAPRFGKGTPRSSAYYERLFKSLGTPDKPSDETRRILAYLLKRDLSKFNGRGTAPETEAKAEMVDANRGSVEKFLLAALEARSPPLAADIINPNDVLDDLPHEIAGHERTTRMVEAALRVIGAKPLSKFGGVSTKSGRKRLWVVNGKAVPNLNAKRPIDIAAMYDEGRQRKRRADAEEASAELGDPWD